MFFFIGENSPVKALNKVSDKLYVDSGWNNYNDIWYKGYSTDCVLADSVQDIISGYQPAGKWCVIKDDKIFHPKLRGFPLYAQDGNITNLPLGYESVQYETFSYTGSTERISLDTASTIIGDVLLENTANFFKYNQIERMNVLFSGGADTLTAWAVMDHYTKDYDLNIYLTKPSDSTLQQQLGVIREYQSDVDDLASSTFWGYRVSSVFKDLNWYTTGYYAEVIEFRDHVAINAIANSMNKKIYDIASESDYLYWFLKRPKVKEMYENTMDVYEDEAALKKFLYETVFYDHQMWHNGNNMTFCPFFDIRIPNTMMQLSVEDIAINALDVTIQRKIVERFNPQLLSLHADYKNEKAVQLNLKKNWNKIKLDPRIRVKMR